MPVGRGRACEIQHHFQADTLRSKSILNMNYKNSRVLCAHKNWSYANKVGPVDGLAVCKDCGFQMSHSSALQLQNLQYQRTFQKWFNVGTIAIALTALGVSIWKNLCN